MDFTKDEVAIVKAWIDIVYADKTERQRKMLLMPTLFKIQRYIDRYGDGDKSPTMNRAEYWVQHLRPEI
jgi:hypothetical protein